MMISAEKARELTNEKFFAHIDAVMDKKVKEAIERGFDSISTGYYWDAPNAELVRNHFKTLGYRIEKYTQLNQHDGNTDYIKIGW